MRNPRHINGASGSDPSESRSSCILETFSPEQEYKNTNESYHPQSLVFLFCILKNTARLKNTRDSITQPLILVPVHLLLCRLLDWHHRGLAIPDFNGAVNGPFVDISGSKKKLFVLKNTTIKNKNKTQKNQKTLKNPLKTTQDFAVLELPKPRNVKNTRIHL